MEFSNDFLSDLKDRLKEHLEDDAFKKKVEEVSRSRLWTKIADVLCARREQLYSIRPTTTLEMAQRDGALAEVQRLLIYGPALVFRAKSSDKSTQHASPDPSPVGMIPSDPHDDDGLG